MLYCAELSEFRDALWRRLLSRFGVKFYIESTSNPPKNQIDLLFTGSREILNNERDITDCILMSFMKIPSHSDILIQQPN